MRASAEAAPSIHCILEDTLDPWIATDCSAKTNQTP